MESNGTPTLLPQVASRDLVAATLEPERDERSHARLGWAVILAGIGGFLLWASLAPLDKGVPMTGTVTVASNKKAVQHMTGGTVETILVKEGDTVKAGDVLVRMNAVTARANAESVRTQYIASRSTESRLLAERDGLKTITFSPELERMRSDPLVSSQLQLQRQLFASRQAAIHAELSSLDENVAGLIVQNRGLEESREGKRQQLHFLQEQLTGMRDLTAEGYVARNRLLELERQHAQLQTAIAEDGSNIGKGLRQIAEFRMRRLQRQQEYQKEVRSQLSDVQRDAQGYVNKLSALDWELANATVRAPVDGTVVAMNVFTNGGVVAPGFRMMDIVPSDDPLIVDGQLPVHLVDKVNPSLPVELIFSAFNQNLTPHVPGIVTHVSADRLVDEKTGQPYYNVKAKVAPEGMRLVASLQIRPGMPVDLFVKTGERTLMNYLLKPVLDHSRLSMREE
ncbi:MULTISPECIES: HlyD family type I secretion periplasmic adaptor subunit [Ramlibacter]|uniref:Membrane fusion protein (MFP) family protein n=1 Tax=Ramlibacter pinisoli TaxID=2682844 RepID=A0A6N8IX76_9BURK|nr:MULTISPECIES: HlyD family type I secretion periplasmic adaptor subunit [Ramlibacter]MBA2961434.1 HlyD family type I secretion periplasmic adaptor subunit [Ramlibacter sp. CGMCC 1.13660]MVQ31378.1 HlyD family type I secretion periplasmic adaptor subunit [Ramlibacter pinisoli]